MRKLLVVVDMQNDFVDGSLGTKEAEGIVDRVVEEIEKYDSKDIFATRDTHPENYLETQEGRKLPVVHCVKGTKGWEINEKVAKALGETEIIDKPTFGSRKLAEKIEKLAEKEELEVTLIGLCTDICVVSNALLIVSAGDSGESNRRLLCGRDTRKPRGGVDHHENVSGGSALIVF